MSLQPELIRTDVCRYPGAPCSHCGVKLRQFQTTWWITPCCEGHELKRKPAAGGAASIVCQECAVKLGVHKQEEEYG